MYKYITTVLLYSFTPLLFVVFSPSPPLLLSSLSFVISLCCRCCRCCFCCCYYYLLLSLHTFIIWRGLMSMWVLRRPPICCGNGCLCIGASCVCFVTSSSCGISSAITSSPSSMSSISPPPPPPLPPPLLVLLPLVLLLLVLLVLLFGLLMLLLDGSGWCDLEFRNESGSLAALGKLSYPDKEISDLRLYAERLSSESVLQLLPPSR